MPDETEGFQPGTGGQSAAADDGNRDHLQIYATFWRQIVAYPSGGLNFDQVARELADYHDLMGWVSEVYAEVTMGRLSKPNTAPRHIIAAVDERIEEAGREAIGGLIGQMEAAECGPFQSTAEVVALVRELTS